MSYVPLSVGDLQMVHPLGLWSWFSGVVMHSVHDYSSQLMLMII